jgi:hypothetical protein
MAAACERFEVDKDDERHCAYCGALRHAHQDFAPCPAPGCAGTSHDGTPGEYCTRSCRAAALAAPPQCAAPGCKRPTWDGKPGEYCGRSCRAVALAALPQCAAPGCKRPTWDGKPGNFCGRRCRAAASAAGAAKGCP